MRVLVPPLYQRSKDPKKPFADDVFGRETLAENLTRLLKATDDGLVITVEGKWGEGKTTFLKMWESLLDSEPGFIPIYYNAFNNDFANDPFVSISATIYAGLKDRVAKRRTGRDTQAQLDYLKKVTKELVIDLAQMSAGLAVSSLSGGFVSSAIFRDWLKRAFQKLTFVTLTVKADEKFEAYMRADDTTRRYQDTLRDLLRGDAQGPNQRVVVFVDELDLK